jgi:ADP-ribosylglycohydrolase
MPSLCRYGKTSETAMQAIWAGAHYTEAGVKSGAGGNGNGSAMRSACLGVLLSGKFNLFLAGLQLEADSMCSTRWSARAAVALPPLTWASFITGSGDHPVAPCNL